ncbi:hypothetical protein NA57DRAFT_79170 [Rhizodiscina lignyota]|uniref:FAS1 domain-containing protein n=1 Tax=Rhizodiscina lignyota TaxID=1504668 RepID=A0A9P4IA04_9PEZI|nr:hypothetical protein NA57DRAFT_79170 [Rhizodiscina lignyota]
MRQVHFLITTSFLSQFSLAALSNTTTTIDTFSIYNVLITALPASLLAEATNTAKLGSDLAAQFSTGTPGWFQSLPSDVKSFLLSEGSALITTVITPTSSPAILTSPTTTWNTTTSLTPTPLSPSPTSQSSTDPPTSSTDPTPPPTRTPDSSGLSTGAKAGIGVGVPLSVIAVTGLVLLAWRWLRRRNNSPPSTIPEMRGRGRTPTLWLP